MAVYLSTRLNLVASKVQLRRASTQFNRVMPNHVHRATPATPLTKQTAQACRNRREFFRSFVSLAPDQLGKSPPLSIWSFNLRSDFNAEKDGEDRWDQRKRGVVELLHKYNPDVIATQELIAQQVEYLGDNLTGYDYEGCCRLGSDLDEYCAIFFRKDKFEVVEGDTIWLSETPETPGSIGWDAMYPRIATWTVLKLLDPSEPERLLTVISTHFDHQGVEARKQSAGLLKGLIEHLQAEFPTSPVMLAGDFNSIKKDNEVYKTLTEGKNPLQDVWEAAQIKEDNGWKRSTMHKFQGKQFADCMGDGTVELCSVEDMDKELLDVSDGKEHIDWILYINAKEGASKIETLKSSVVTDSLPSGRYPSDHFPVFAEVAVSTT
eukprot:CAMPEP_0167750902 /NCGR_PEP_ID=MMETSP0110_2-20121227/6249_1 /TAXON_ID=629695 /ORGANISM="Gymnochlora sp., Strain CCMP2014" /LENGTH=377 /DNA_ID=CAMNT_0007636275 /DNA_START=78 /DNA_END=1211 /DNA_ORIENTATION=-